MAVKTVKEIAYLAKQTSLKLAHLSTEVKDRALIQMAEALENYVTVVLNANAKDLEFADKENISGPLKARLALNEDKVLSMAKGIRSVAQLADPVNQKQSLMELDKGLVLHRLSCPIGVIGAIFESRPDAVPQISSLCLKSGNSVILKGGTEAQNSNKTIVSLLVEAVRNIPEIPEGTIQIIETRLEVAEMLEEDTNINLIVPRGSNEFVKFIQENTKIPVLGHSEGICHCYIDREADFQKAVRIVLDSKTQYPAACNAIETLLIHKDIAGQILPVLIERFEAGGVELLGCGKTREVVSGMKPAVNEDWDTEYTDLKLSVKIVSSEQEAIDFINTHGSGHTDSIITENKERAGLFLNEVDSATVMCNASTRFADGFRYGLGAEIGISTNKTHARGPVGLDGLVIYKYRLIGNGQIVADYTGKNGKAFTHIPFPLEK